MGSIPAQTFGALMEQYQNATSLEDRRIRLKLQQIDACYRECQGAEREFADEMVEQFCQLIDLLEKRNEEEWAALMYKYETDPARYTPVAPEEKPRFETAEELLEAFYDRFKAPDALPYAQISRLRVQDRKGRANATLNDYVARIKTFVRVYLWDIPQAEALLRRQQKHLDPVLFTYEHLELLLATFDTRDENGQPVKQKVNIRSALRKLNEFKREQERQ